MKSQTVYKLTDKKAMTYNGTQWGPGATHEAPGKGELYSGGWIHAYSDPLLAILLNPIHANFDSPRLWKSRGEGAEKSDRGLLVGFSGVTTIREVPPPTVTTVQRVRFAILCALHVSHGAAFARWAGDWLSDKNRSAGAVESAEAAGAAWILELGWAGNAAAWTGNAAKGAARAADASAMAEAAAWTTEAAHAAARAAWAAAKATESLDLTGLARKATQQE